MMKEGRKWGIERENKRNEVMKEERKDERKEET